MKVLRLVLRVESVINACNILLGHLTPLDDLERYLKMAMKINSSDSVFLLSYGKLMWAKQDDLDPAERDYGYIEYLRKSLENSPDPSLEVGLIQLIKSNEGRRDYYTPSLKQINHLIQIDQKPDLELLEPKWELYKISISFLFKLHKAVVSHDLGVTSLKGSNHRVFFQNAEGNINMGVLFNDPDVDWDDIYWYNTLAEAMENSLYHQEGLISVETIKLHNSDKEIKTYSCYAELHRNGLDNGTMQNRFLKLDTFFICLSYGALKVGLTDGDRF